MKISTKDQQIVLASKSVTRAELLKKHSINAKIINHMANEESLKKSYGKTKLHLLSNFLAKEKVKSVEHLFKDQIIIASDQILLCKDKLLSKPKNKVEALQNLLFLQNQKHILISSICLLTEKREYLLHKEQAILFMKTVSKEEIKHYINENEDIVFSTVGSYKIEDDKLGCLNIIEGSMETILGFPISKFLPILKNTK